MPTFIPLEFFTNNKCIYLLLVIFFYRQANHLLSNQKRIHLLYYLENVSTRSLSLPLGFLLVNLSTQPLESYLVLPYYIIISKSETNVLIIKI